MQIVCGGKKAGDCRETALQVRKFWSKWRCVKVLQPSASLCYIKVDQVVSTLKSLSGLSAQMFECDGSVYCFWNS